jgi:hypothetical protein
MKRRSIFLILATGALLVTILMLVSKSAGATLSGRVAQDRARDVARFTPENSIDISMAMGMVTHAPPKMLNPPSPPPLTLLYPPSSDTLERMCGA